MFLRALTYMWVLVFIVTIFMYANVTKAQMVTDGLVGYWPLDEDTITGGTVEDVWGENDGTLQGDPKIVAGRIEKFYQEVCLLNQPFVRDQDITIQELVNQKIAKIGENIQVRRFARYMLGE